MTTLRTVIWITIILFLLIQSACTRDVTHHGKVVDAETLEPIQGAVVVTIWRKTRIVFLIASTTDFKDAKEALTDKNGEWAITGPEGDENKAAWLLRFIGVYATTKPQIIIYKPGYRRGIRGGFSAYPYIDKKYNLEGIVLSRLGETMEEIREYSKKYPVGTSPFIPVKDPEKKLKELDFSFEYPENVKTVGWQKEMGPVYHVIGLKKAQTKKERLEARRITIAFEGRAKLPLLKKMVSEERERLLGPVSGKAK